MAAAKDRRKCWFIHLLCSVCEVYLSDLVQAVENDGESRIVERVTRRHITDVFFFINSTYMNCGYEKTTYLVSDSEDSCVSNQELFSSNIWSIFYML